MNCYKVRSRMFTVSFARLIFTNETVFSKRIN